MPGELILIVDDETNIVQLARMYLEREGFRVETASDGKAALEMATRLRPAVMVLDLMLPEKDGFEVCRQLRSDKNAIPIIMLTARDEDIDKILGLELGADDYMTKPFNPRELVARVKAILRRGEYISQSVEKPVWLGNLLVDPARREVKVDNQLVELRGQEFELLWALIQNKGLVLSRERLLSLAWGYDYAGQTRTVDVHIAHLRKKITTPDVHIETVTRIGYKIVVNQTGN
jgi:two-component system alkaline phosphatase synthesis response regulator PhoP